jgi:Carboxypeptidase regulatory-like domain
VTDETDYFRFADHPPRTGSLLPTTLLRIVSDSATVLSAVFRHSDNLHGPRQRPLRKVSIPNQGPHRTFGYMALSVLWLLFTSSSNLSAASDSGRISGKILDLQGVAVAGAHLRLIDSAGSLVRETTSDTQGNFTLDGIHRGEYQLRGESDAFVSVTVDISLDVGQQKEISLQFQQMASVRQAITVVASAPSSLTPDPNQTVVIRDQVLDANPGRPGAPISIPGLPIETASSGIKAPQYFAPGVAGDHGEPIAQFFQIGNFLFPNNLPANAHGNGYSDPNFLIPPVIEGVTVDGGAFNVREGNHSIDLAAAYLPRQRFNDFVQLTGDYRDFDLMAGWSPENPQTNGWIAGEVSFGNGFLERLEHRQQYKLNGLREFKVGRNQLTIFGIGYYGFSYVPGLIPINMPVPGDTIDNRQSDTTHNILLVATDNWKLGEQRQFSFSGFVRNYALQLRSNFGDGLIQQSETRNVLGGEATYIQSVHRWISLLAGVDIRRDAPRNLDLKRTDANGTFQPVTSNNLTISFLEPFVSLDGTASKHLHYDVGVRQEEVWMNNQDIINPRNSFNKLATLSLPKVTLTFLPPDRPYLPTVAFSYGEAFHTEDPRIGNGTGQPTLLAPSRAYQLRISKVIKQTQIDLTLRRTSNSQELAKIDPDTGLQVNNGPSLNRVMAISVQRNFSHGAIYISYAQADARDTQTGLPVPEAPRMIWDAVASENHLPFHLQVRGEFEFVKAKPLGAGFVGVPVTEVRGAILRPFFKNRMSLGANFLIAHGYTGQTTETIPFQPAQCPIECVVGVPLKSYVSLSWTYYFKK